MGTQKISSLSKLKTHFGFVDKGLSEEFVYMTMLRFANSVWVFACKFLFYLFGFIVRHTFRSEADDRSHKSDCNCRVDHSQGEDQIASGSSKTLEPDRSGKKENPDFFFGFQFHDSEIENSAFVETSPTLNTNKCQAIYTKDFRGFMAEPETTSFTIHESFVGSNDDAEKGCQELHHLEEVQELPVGSNDSSTENDQIINGVSVVDEDFQELSSKTEDSVESQNVLEKPEQVISTDYDLDRDKEIPSLEHNHPGLNNLSDEVELLSSTERISIGSLRVDSVSNEFNSEDGGLEPEPDNPMPVVDEKMLEFTEKIPNSEEVSIGGKAEGTEDEYIDLEPSSQCSNRLDRSFHRRELGGFEKKHEQENLQSNETEPIDSFGKSEEPSSQKKSRGSDSDDDDDEFDILLKHQDLIEQMKMVMKNARTKGLPTILEESETPKMVEDLKPLEIFDKFEHKDRMEEIQKVYKSYAEKMRKLDILNYQTLHAISFLRLKDPEQQALGQKSSVSAIKSLLFPNFWPSKLRRIHADPTLKSISELHIKLEMVYVGQVCLSWEILHWQYGKAKEFLEHDSDGHRLYNQVAGEFQQFQVLVQRFVENEQFHGPRVQNYAKNRCELRTLLQVPAIKDDCSNDRRDKGENLVSIAMLTETIDESMHVFWEFLHADKDEASAIFKGLPASHVDLQDPSDSELLLDIRTSLQKKEKRLKDILRSGNCIVKKFQKHQEGRMDRALLLAQVELKLVSRVLNMSRLTTDQLVWCKKKLNKINFFGRKIRVEPSFLLFPI